MLLNHFLLSIAVSFTGLADPAGPRGPADSEEPIEWNARSVEHLLNRAGFGARREEIEDFVELGQADAVALLLEGPRVQPDPFFVEPRAPRDLTRSDRDSMLMEGAEGETRKTMVRRLKRNDQMQLIDYKSWWVERMLAGEDPLRERMTLFWHGYFTTSNRDVKSSYEMVRQNQFLREHALGRFGELLDGVSRDPAMLEYLDNDSNVRSHPNENFARELLELFTLGEGNYTEDDVRAAARAFTGWTDHGGEFKFRPKQHDFGRKTFLGVEGRLNGADIIRILLEQELCATRLAGRLLGYFEGEEPRAARLEEYASVLLETDYDIRAFLQKLFVDPRFYRREIVGNRIAGPVEFLVGHARRLGVRPPELLLVGGAAALGESLMEPPNVKGWEGGKSWITTSSLMLRGNLAGFLVGAVELSEVARDWEPDEGMAMDAGLPGERAEGAPMRGPASSRLRDPEGLSPRVFGSVFEGLRGSGRIRWKPRLNFSWRVKNSGAISDEQIVASMCADLLAIEVGADTLEYLRTVLEEQRRRDGVGFRNLLDLEADAERILRGLAHVILSLPEAQLN